MSIEYHMWRAAQIRQAADELAAAQATGRPTPLPDHLRPRAVELATFYRELPQLVADGDDGRFVVLRGDAIESVWDTARDANQHGHDRFDDGEFLTARVDLRWCEGLERYFIRAVPESA